MKDTALCMGDITINIHFIKKTKFLNPLMPGGNERLYTPKQT